MGTVAISMPVSKGLVFWLAMSVSTVVAADELGRLIEREDYAAAYELAQRQLDNRGGDLQFDFFYGLAALETGHANEAAFAFERVLMVEPNNQRARLELARAYFVLGNMDRSQQLFERVKATKPPPQVESNIQRFLEQIQKYKRGAESHIDVTMGVSLGMDSNVNSATDAKTVDTTFFGTLPLSEASRASDDTFSTFDVDVNYLRLINKRLAWFAGADFTTRINYDLDQYNTRQLALDGGLAWKWGRHGFRLPLQAQRLDVDQEHFRDLTTAGLEWNMPVGHGQVAMFAQLGRMAHPEQEIRDADMRILGGAWSKPLEQTSVTVLFSAYLGQEETRQAAGDFHGREYIGLRVGALWQAGIDHSVNLVANLQSIEHDAIHPLLSLTEVREDDMTQVNLSWQWQLKPQWQLGVNFGHTGNQSNLGLYSYSRAQQYLSLKYQY